jgi:hypothetical protein
LHAAVAARSGQFAYLEIGSYLGGSLQVMIRDPRCHCIMSIDPRLAEAPGKDSVVKYDHNSTAHMRELLARVPGADLDKLVTLDKRAEDVTQDELPTRPNLCFVDGEHTDEAVLRDAELCASAIRGNGVIAFHDYAFVRSGIHAFVRDHWHDISTALGIAGIVFAVEMGDDRVLRSPVIDRAVGSSWHSAAWKVSNVWRRSPTVLLSAATAMLRADQAIARHRGRASRW